SIADLVDNSIDATATKVLIRFVKSGGRLHSLYVADNGKGMDARTLRRAMQFGARREYDAKDLGLFGVGLKTASLSQAQILTVISRERTGMPVGRQWTRDGIKKKHWTVNILSQSSVKPLLDRHWGLIGPIRAGTIVFWDRVNDFDRLRVEMDGYLDRAI